MKQSLRTPSVSVHYLSIITNALKRMGYPAIQGNDYDNTLNEDERYIQRVSADVLFDTWQQAEQLTQDPLIGLHIGERIHPMDFGLLGQLMMNCHSLGEAIEQVFAAEFVLNNAFASQVIITKELAINRIYDGQYEANTMRHVAEQDISALINIGAFVMNRDYCDSDRPIEVHFRHSAGGSVAEYERTLGCPVKFDQQYSQVIFPIAVLEQPIYNPSPRVAKLLAAELQSLIEDIELSDTLATRIWRYLRTQDFAALPDIEQTACHFNMTPRTLQRHLQQEETSFQYELNQFKAVLAKNMLNNKKQPISKTAYNLGFHDLSSFHKAFKRWTGLTPGEYQRSLP